MGIVFLFINGLRPVESEETLPPAEALRAANALRATGRKERERRLDRCLLGAIDLNFIDLNFIVILPVGIAVPVNTRSEKLRYLSLPSHPLIREIT